MVCKKCGHEMSNGTRFCTNCGCLMETTSEANVNNSEKKKSKKKLIPIIVVTVVAIISAVVIAVLAKQGLPISQFKKALEANDGTQVVELYMNTESEKQRQKYDDLIGQYLNGVIDELSSMEIDTEKLAIKGSGEDYLVEFCAENWGNMIYDIEQDSDGVIFSILSESNSSLYDKFYTLAQSKLAYCDGLLCIAKNVPDLAINYLSKVIESDGCYDNAVEKISECIDLYVKLSIDEADKVLESGDIGGALDILESVKTVIAEEGIPTTEIEQKIKTVMEAYAEKYFKKAEEAFGEKNLDMALGNMEVAMELSPDNATYKQKYDTYQLYKPFALYDEDNCYNKSVDYYSLHFNVNDISNNNREMNNSLTWSRTYSSYSGSAEATYDLDGKYDTLSGTIYVSKEYRDAIDITWFKVYGDEKLLYESDNFSGGKLPKDFSINVSDVHKLTILFSTDDGGDGSCGTYGISNFIAQKKFPSDEK